MSIAQRIKAARTQQKLSQAALAEKCGWAGDGNQGRISHYETGRRQPTLSDIEIIANALGIAPAELTYGEIREQTNVYEAEIKGFIPLISWVQAGQWAEAIDIYQPGDGESVHPTTVRHSSSTFALRVDGDSMTAPPGAKHSFPQGMIIYVDPEKRGDVVTGDYVVAKHNGHGHVTFKQLGTEEGRPVLKPLNTNGLHHIIRDEFEIIGKVIDAGWGGL